MTDTDEALAGMRAYLVEMATGFINGGFRDEEEILDALVDHFAYEDPPLPEDEVRATATPMIAARRAVEATWPERTDTDLLDDAFDALSAAGITTAEDFACCLRCGISEIGDEAEEGSRGFVFYHQQDTDHAAAGDGLMLAYGAFGGDKAESLAIGREVAAAIRAAGLNVEWGEDVRKRILVKPLDWRRRMP